MKVYTNLLFGKLLHKWTETSSEFHRYGGHLIKKFLYKQLLPRLIANSCESRIPRSGKRGEKVNCYVVALDSNGSPFFVANKIDGELLLGLKWNGNSYTDDHQIPISEIDLNDFSVTHYYGLSEVIYNSIYDVAWNYITKYVYIKIHIYRYINSTSQYFFNKKKLVTKKRMDLLKFMMNDQLDRDHNGISSFYLLKKIYSTRLFLHPDWEIQQQKLDLYLDSLVKSKDLEIINNEYVVTGVAISTIERYEEEERRHSEAVKLQRRMFWLTFVALIFAFVQTGVVKLPTLLDFSSNTSINETDRVEQETPRNDTSNL